MTCLLKSHKPYKLLLQSRQKIQPQMSHDPFFLPGVYETFIFKAVRCLNQLDHNEIFLLKVCSQGFIDGSTLVTNSDLRHTLQKTNTLTILKTTISYCSYKPFMFGVIPIHIMQSKAVSTVTNYLKRDLPSSHIQSNFFSVTKGQFKSLLHNE